MGKKTVLLFSLLTLLFFAVSTQLNKENGADSKRTAQSQKLVAAEPDTLLEYMTFMKNESHVYRDQGENAKAVQVLTECVNGLWRQPRTTEEFEKLAWIYTNRAYFFNNKFGDFLAAKEDYLSALKQFESCEPSSYLVARYVYQPLGNIYTRLGENEIAISMLEKFKLACEESEETGALMSAYNDIGKAYLNMGEVEKGIEWMSKGIELDQTDNFTLGLLYSSKAEAEIEIGNYQEALKSAENCINHVSWFRQSAAHSDFRFNMSAQYKVTGLSTKANVLSRNENYEEAHQLYERVSALAEEVYPEGHRARARAILQLGNSFNDRGDMPRALKHYQLSLCSMFDDLNEEYSANPEQSELYADVVLGEVLYQKALLTHEYFRMSGDQSWLEISVNTYLKYFEWVEIQRAVQFEFNSKLGAANEIHTVGQHALSAYYDLYEASSDAHWIDTAFILMDQTKAIVLAEERGFKDLADKNPEMRSMLKEQNALKIQRSSFNEDLRNAQEEGVEIDIIRLKKRIGELDKQSQLLDQEIRSLFPSYRTEASSKLKGENFLQLKCKLNEKKASALSYFVGNEWVYAIMGTPDKFEFMQFSRDELTDKTVSFMSELNSPNSSTASEYSKAGKSLFDLLIGDRAKQLKANWVVLPDGALNNFPFEALVSGEEGTSFKKLKYLMRDHVIRYAPSAFFFVHDDAGKKANESFLGIAPVFKSSKSYDYLPKSKDELEAGTSLFSGEELIEAKATKKRFFEKAEQYDIIHISTHAGTNSGTNNDAWMVFSDSKSKDHKLEAHELLKLDLPASLVVLNACETGRGTVFEGEGPMSLARGFLNAGSESAIMNLWSVNHESNAVIMKNFYENLSETQSPSQSLNQAKLDYLNSSEIDEASAHPYYWSSAILVGTDASVVAPNPSPIKTWILIGLISIVSVIFVFIGIRKKRKMKRVA